jgi:leucyl/phenylalanyl-tRNA--protein transferase
LVGGVYGVRIGRFFAGESMFHRRTDASKVALWALTATMKAAGIHLFDVQWTTPHLVSLGAIDVPRARYLGLLSEAKNA